MKNVTRNINHNRPSNSYKVDLRGRHDDEDCTVYVNDKGHKYTFFFKAEQLNGQKSLHFRYVNGEIVWGPIKPQTHIPTTQAKERKDVSAFLKMITKKNVRKDSDEAYVIDLCDEVLGIQASRQHTFPFLVGDGAHPRCLPVDAYYEPLNLVVEYRELQHSESVPFFDKPDKKTVSGVSRGEQRVLYDNRRRNVLPKHGINLVEISYFDFIYEGKSKRLVRNREADLDVVRNKLSAFL